MAVWVGMLACFTYIFARDGSPPEAGAFGLPLLALFWLAALGVAGWALAQPLIRVTVQGRHAVVRERWLWGVRERRYRATALAAPDLEVGEDSDGDPYFKCLLLLPGGAVLTIAEAHDRAFVEDAQQRLETALGAGR
jgi:hypothetical protein